MERAESFDKQNYEDGITRKKNKNDEFEYFYITTNKKVNKKDEERIKKLRIPPAWNDVWIAKNVASKIQVIGIDGNGKKQYLYHPEHIKQAEKEKFIRLEMFTKAIPSLELSLLKHKRQHPYSLEHVIATMLELVKKLHFRVGKEQYAKQNKSYGISSLKKSHIKLNENTIKFNFKAKSRQNVSYTLIDKTIKDHIQELLKLQGEKLFQYVDPDSETIKIVRDHDLNDYIHKYMGDYTVKDFRTYGANYHFIEELLKETQKHNPTTLAQQKKNILNAVEKTAFFLRHTKSISKKSYIMNFAIDQYINNPSFFIKRKNKDPTLVMLELLKMKNKN